MCERYLVYVSSCHMPHVCQVLKVLVGLICIGFMQKPFQFDLAISIAKNLVFVWLLARYKLPTDFYVTSKSWCTSGIHHHKWPYVNADGNFLQMGHWLVYVLYMRYTTGTPANHAYDR